MQPVRLQHKDAESHMVISVGFWRNRRMVPPPDYLAKGFENHVGPINAAIRPVTPFSRRCEKNSSESR